MNTVFADTAYYIALLSPRDQWHERATAFTDRFGGRMTTTAWVLTELANGLAASTDRPALIRFIDHLRNEPNVIVIPPAEALFDRGLALYAARPDKQWSLTDCISFVVMHDEGLTEALTADHHFEQAGFAALLK